MRICSGIKKRDKKQETRNKRQGTRDKGQENTKNSIELRSRAFVMYVSRSEIESTYPLFTKQTLRLQIDASENTQTTPIICKQDYTSRKRSSQVVTLCIVSLQKTLQTVSL